MVMKFILFFISMVFCGYMHAQNLKIKVYNKTGFDVSALKLCDQTIGLKKDSVSAFVPCPFFYEQMGNPSGFAEGDIKGKTRNQGVKWRFSEPKTITQGTYEFDLEILDAPEGYLLLWKYHK